MVNIPLERSLPAMGHSASRVTPTANGVGAEVEGIDASRPIDDATGNLLRSLLARHRVLVLRDQTLDAESQIRLMSLFGKVVDESRDGSRHSYVTADDNSMVKPGRLLFHSDNHFTKEPLEVLSLYGQIVDDSVAPTLFVDNILAFRRLPASLVKRIGMLEALNISYYFWGQGSDRPARSVEPDIPEAPRAYHPLIWHHPVTGEPFVYATELHTHSIRDMPIEASDRLLAELRAHLYVAEGVYAHHWRVGDLVIWDNRAAQHARGPMPERTAMVDVPARSLRRVVVGTKDFHDQVVLPASIPEAAR